MYGRLAAAIAASRGKRAGRRRELAEFEQDQIRQLAAQGKSQRAIARVVGVSRDQVQRLLAT
jgi:DNA invertase Pin-like site-specific DNA recombinase